MAKFEGTKTSKKGAKGVSKDWLNATFDICKCKCEISETPKIFNGKVTCCCSWQHRILQETTFLINQTTSRKMNPTFQKKLTVCQIEFNEQRAWFSRPTTCLPPHDGESRQMPFPTKLAGLFSTLSLQC